ncbi:conjugative transfer system coupling protein TraD [Acidovorax sp. LjRoot129]|uniref:conjugative transfer system coupling protein TraD n=1 Tax=unclassified Acidovorax TaxID=2684926 RepID=UPI003ECEA804
MAEHLFDFDNPWRPNYEAGQALGWFGAFAVCIASVTYTPLPTTFAAVAAFGCGGMALLRLSKAWARYSDKARTNITGKTFIDIEGLKKASKNSIKNKELWLGHGFQWTDIESQRMHALIASGVAKTLGKEATSKDGSYWLHGLQKEADVSASLELLEGHTLIVGSTGVGKTRLFDLMIGQAILRGEPVIIIDPKGDQGLADNARRICESMGQPDRFVYFNPAHPEKSACLDPLRNWNRKTELASRVAALIPSETGADAFVAFGWKVLQDICAGLIATGARPNLVSLRRYIEGGPDDLLVKGLQMHFRQKVKNWEEGVASYVKQNQAKGKAKGQEALLMAYIQYYKEVVIHEWPNVDLQGLISTYEHNREHFQKMVASLIPILSMLTADPLAELLSPDPENANGKIVLDMSRVIRNDMVLYMGLDSLADPTVGSAIGSVMLADMTAVAGDLYNYGEGKRKPIAVFVDEAAEVINTPTIQLLNKGRGAGFRLTIATQTFADFSARLGDENKALQVLANTNNKIALRVQDTRTQQFFADGIPKIKAQSMSVSYGHNVAADASANYDASYKEQSTAEEADLIPPAILSELPPLHFYARMSGGRTFKARIPILITDGPLPKTQKPSFWSMFGG